MSREGAIGRKGRAAGLRRVGAGIAAGAKVRDNLVVVRKAAMSGRGWVRWVATALCATGCSSGGAAADGGVSVDAGAGGDVGTHQDGGRDAGAGLCVEAEGSGRAPTDMLVVGEARATVTLVDPGQCLRRYQLRTTGPLRDNQPGNPRTVEERAGWPRLRTRNELFDALYAMSLEETRENAVASIRDGAFNNGQPLACPPEGCFETGRLWNYVWTRDTAYSVDLGLGGVDPLRARNSLAFKLSARRAGGDVQVVQDTGTGGSYPVSTDRVAWAVGAAELLKWLDGDARTAFAASSLEALRNTVEHDRAVVYDAVDGLYTGEHSFLDWREQSYPGWTAQEHAHIAMSRSLSTNVLHYAALDLVARLATESGDTAAGQRYRGWADALRDRIRARFWLEDAQQFSAFVTTLLDPAPTRRWDMLGTALAILTGVATEAQGRAAMASYPRAGEMGPAVLWPQQQLTPIYHNRAAWPFVTSYGLRAARRVGNDAVVTRDVWALVRGAAANLSNMENFEWPGGRARFEDGPYTGPVVNSQRQLWSVAAYLSMVHDVVFGMEADDRGLRFRPWLPVSLRESLLPNADTLVLDGVAYRGKTLTVVLRLPPRGPAGEGGVLVPSSVRLDGRDVGDGFLPAAMLPMRGTLEVTLARMAAAPAAVREVDPSNWRAVFGPRTPELTDVAPAEGGAGLALRFTTSEEDRSAVAFNIYRDGERVASMLPGTTSTWVDAAATDHATRTRCYAVEAVFAATGNHSQHSAPRCYWGPGGARVRSLPASGFANTGGQRSDNHGRTHFENWGDPGHRLVTQEFVAAQSGPALVQAVYANGAGGFTTGVTCGVHRVVVNELDGSGAVVGEGYLAMPHTGGWSMWRESTFVRARLTAGRRYQVVVGGDDPRAVNMSAFRHFEAYTGGLGGTGGAFNRVNIAEVKVLSLGGP